MISGKKKYKCSKISFSEDECRRIIKENKKSGHQWRRERRYYKCPYPECKGRFHLTSKEETEEDLEIEVKHKKLWQRMLENQ